MYLQLDSTQYCQFDFLITLKKHPETDKLYYVQLSHHVDKGGGISDNAVSLEFKNSDFQGKWNAPKVTEMLPKNTNTTSKKHFREKSTVSAPLSRIPRCGLTLDTKVLAFQKCSTQPRKDENH